MPSQPTTSSTDANAIAQFNIFDSGSGEGGSEVVSVHNGRLYVTNGEEDRIDIFDIASGALIDNIDLTAIPRYDGVNSVSVSDAGIAVAVERAPAELDSPSMLVGENGWTVDPLFTVGAELDNGYLPTGLMDGIGAIKLDDQTVRVYVNHELGSGDGYEYDVDGITLTGARISYLDIDIATKSIVDGGQAITRIVDAGGNVATDTGFTFEDKPGFERFCSSALFEADAFGAGRGIVNDIYFTGEETGGNYSGVGGGEWALDIATGTIYALPAFGRGAWENVTQLDTGNDTHVAFLLADDTSPFDPDGDGEKEGAPVYLYVGEKDANGDFLAQNGLSGGKLYVWVPEDGSVDPRDFAGTGNTLGGSWVEIDNNATGTPSEDGSTGYDEWGYPTQRTLWQQAEDAGAFQFSRPEDTATNPDNGSEAVLASTGRSSDFDGADQVGTIYTIDVDFSDLDNLTAEVRIAYDGDNDPSQALRSPDNLDWADDGYIYIQEDRANGDLFDEDAPNQNDASILKLDPETGTIERIAHIDQSVHLPFGAVEENYFYSGGQDNGDWESSGILDVSTLFGEAPGTLFIADVQAHGLDDQDRFNVNSPAWQLTDDNLKEGGQLVLIGAPGVDVTVDNPVDPTYNVNGVVAVYDVNDTAADPELVTVGNLPDMVTFSKDGSYIFVANEGEPTGSGDPRGSISVIDVATMTSQTFYFTQFDAQADALAAAGVRIFPGKLPSTDFEPEYIAEGENGKLYVSLQEANALAIFDLATMSWDDVVSLGFKDHSVDGAGLDPNDKDGAIAIDTHPVLGMRMPDAIATAEIDGQTYVLTANEGDDRGDWDEGGDAARVGDIVDGEVPGVSIDPDAYTAEELEALARLNVSIIDGDTDGDGDIDQLYSYGARSFTIYDAEGNLVFDSGDDFEQIIAAERPANAFNNDDYPSDDPDVVDENRSDNKGPEPEAIAVGEVDGHVLAFIGLERDSGIMIYDITDPANSAFVDYIDSSEFGHVSPEVISFIPAEDSETGLPQIAVSYEVSGTTALYDLKFGETILGTNFADDLEGTIGDDAIVARHGADIVDGKGGDDSIRGDDGADILMGGAGDDLIAGGRGADSLNGGLGNDTLLGGNGADMFLFAEGDGEDTVIGLQAIDKIDLSATGLGFGDLEITHLGGRRFEVEFGTQGDEITVILTEGNDILNQQDFIF